ncbi:MAG TPA: adenylate/guanylate cyclase domain-containing protein [Rectinema sp.]|jgi:class 3 adenylate cyclase|nr:adenylate/guanylate cyclase domain-containing protein [Rectinema sp.]HOM92436.1 adenylate/guanylate cyclase domain-containing protein [Rectinema sp.]HOR49200.1 adenylate/guanylate cyclase domain-containing protein [Rectinema sp.]HPL71974.1 adenylate/guanylate cyclase domain-containing protein [Rectinema sp.]HQE68866.1 adenylate/guanylate cyclase domain-containing protein [Rectinema sp.]
MQFSWKRFADELYYYSNQFILFFVLIISLTSGSWKNALVTSLIVLSFMLIQTLLLTIQGHIPILRFIYSFITPAGYSILRATLSDIAFTETVNLLLWGASVYIAIFQTLTLILRKPILKRFSEAALSLGSAIIFLLFYAYLDLRISVTASFVKGEIDAEAMAQALGIRSFFAVFNKFFQAPQHLFALFGVISFDFMLMVARWRAINLEQRLTRIIEMPQEAKRIYSSSPESEKGASPLEYEGQEVQPVLTTETQDSLPTKTIASLFVTAISSDIIGFTDLSEQLGHKEATALLNRYYAIWTRCAGSYGGRIVSISADTVVILFGLVDQERSADRALNASYAFIEELEGLREDMIIKSLPGEIKVSLGIHSGFVTRALLGPPGQQKISFFGDTIGIAARLDSLCREFHQSLLVSHATYRRLTLESQVTLERFSEALLRKSTRPMPLYTKKP